MMRSILGMGLLAGLSLPPMILLPDPPRRGKRTYRITTGKTYPHSSSRQRARYARQVAAGQIK